MRVTQATNYVFHTPPEFILLPKFFASALRARAVTIFSYSVE